MPDDLTKRGGQDKPRINLHDEYEVRDWCKKLGVTKEQLAAAVQAVGNNADAVAKELQHQHPVNTPG